MLKVLRGQVLSWLALAAVMLVPAGSALAASFDCTKAATQVEKAICTNSLLSELDTRMANAYDLARWRIPEVKQEQRNWLAQRNTCTSDDCLAAAYQGRIMALEAHIARYEKDAGHFPSDEEPYASLPGFKAGVDYEVVRKTMLAAGFTPVSAIDASLCLSGDARCEGREEMGFCSYSGHAVCRFSWSRSEVIVGVCTRGERAVFFDYCDDWSAAAGVEPDGAYGDVPYWEPKGNYFSDAREIIQIAQNFVAGTEFTNEFGAGLTEDDWARCEASSSAQRTVQHFSGGASFNEAVKGALLSEGLYFTLANLGLRGQDLTAADSLARHAERMRADPDYYLRSLTVCLNLVHDTLVELEMGRHSSKTVTLLGVHPPAAFDCAKAATAVERMICASPELGELDARMNSDFHQARVLIPGIRGEQPAWLAQRNACVSHDCVAEAYRRRIHVLQERLARAALNAAQGISVQELAARPPEHRLGEAYGQVRQTMLAAGWVPLISVDVQPCAPSDSRCQGRPEMEACAGTGYAPCRFTWQRGDVKVGICTRGEEALFYTYCEDKSAATGVDENGEALEEPAWSVSGENHFIESVDTVRVATTRVAGTGFLLEFRALIDATSWGRCEAASSVQRISAGGMSYEKAVRGALLMEVLGDARFYLKGTGGLEKADATRMEAFDLMLEDSGYYTTALGACLKHLDEALARANISGTR